METDFNRAVGRRLYEARKAKGYSRAKVGELVGLHETTVKRYEDGEIKALDIERLKKFAEVLGIEPADLLGWSKEKWDEMEWAALSPESREASERICNMSDRLSVAIPNFLSQLDPDDTFITQTSTFAPDYPGRLMALTWVKNPLSMSIALAASDCDSLPEDSLYTCFYALQTFVYNHRGISNPGAIDYFLASKKNSSGVLYSKILEDFLLATFNIAYSSPETIEMLLPILKKFVPDEDQKAEKNKSEDSAEIEAESK